MSYAPLSERPPSYTTTSEPAPPPPVAGSVQITYGAPSLQQHMTAGPVIYNTGASQAFTYTPPKRTYENYHGRQSIVLGVIMILAGVLCVIFKIVSLVEVEDHISIIGYGIWSGVMFIITGIFGVVVATNKTMCKVVGFMVLCVVSSVLCLVLFMLSVIAAVTIQYSWSCNPHYYNGYGTTLTTPVYPPGCSTVKVMEALLACLAVIVTICTIWGSVLCCKAVCCCAGTGQQVILPVQYIPAQGNQQMLFYPMQQGGVQGSSTGIINGSDVPSASGGSYNFPYNPHQYEQGPPIYTDHKVPL